MTTDPMQQFWEDIATPRAPFVVPPRRARLYRRLVRRPWRRLGRYTVDSIIHLGLAIGVLCIMLALGKRGMETLTALTVRDKNRDRV